MSPLARTGGLGDVTAGLSAYLHRSGHDVRVFLPLYQRILDSDLDPRPVDSSQDIDLHLGPHQLRFSLATAHLPGGQPVYLVHCPPLFNRPDLYSSAPARAPGSCSNTSRPTVCGGRGISLSRPTPPQSNGPDS